MISRRRLLAGGAGAVALTGLGAWTLGRLGLQERIVSVINARLHFLTLDQSGVHAFARDQTAAVFNKKIPTWNRLRYHFMAAVSPSFGRFYQSTDHRSRVDRLDDSIVSTYLLSSDFFWNHSDESRTVKYVAYFDPLRPCQNPFARPAVAS